MTFLMPLALLLGLIALAPILAHALKKGRATPLLFPATHLVQAKSNKARKRHRIEDKLLLTLRVLLLLSLALLAASPLMQCSRFSLQRENGASLAAVLIVDDSGSMQALLGNGKTRLESAVERGEEVLAGARAGDSFGIVLAGKPARILTPPAIDLAGVREALAGIEASDRRTDLKQALVLARALQVDLPQKDRPIVLLSDLSVYGTADLNLENVVLPANDIRRPLSNCAVLRATATEQAVLAEIACTDAKAVNGRKIQIVDDAGRQITEALPAKDGAVQLPLVRKSSPGEESRVDTWVAHLTPHPTQELDQIRADDECSVLTSSTNLTVGIRADQNRAGVKTGSGTLFQAAISALDRGIGLQNLSLLPEKSSALDELSALFIDDPSGFTPEVSEALHSWIKSGGVAVLLLGPGIKSTPLGAGFSPFLSEAPVWSQNPAKGVDKKVAGTLGPLTTSWDDLHASHRATLSVPTAAATKARFEDGAPLVSESILGRGLMIVSTLPSSTDESDFALRPAFIELVDYVLSQSAIRRGALATLVGDNWALHSRVHVEGPGGTLLTAQSLGSTQFSADEQYISPPLAGRYTIKGTDDADPSYRYALRDSREQIQQPSEQISQGSSNKNAAQLAKVDISREIALLALVLGALELAFRAFRRNRL